MLKKFCFQKCTILSYILKIIKRFSSKNLLRHAIYFLNNIILLFRSQFHMVCFLSPINDVFSNLSSQIKYHFAVRCFDCVQLFIGIAANVIKKYWKHNVIIIFRPWPWSPVRKICIYCEQYSQHTFYQEIFIKPRIILFQMILGCFREHCQDFPFVESIMDFLNFFSHSLKWKLI